MIASRLLLELFLFLMPFMMFGLYRLAIAEAKEEGRKPWPIYWLFGAGSVLAVGVWFVLIVLDRGGRDECYTPHRLVDGEMVGGEVYPCEKDLANIGAPLSEDPGGRADGVGTPDPAGPDE